MIELNLYYGGLSGNDVDDVISLDFLSVEAELVVLTFAFSGLEFQAEA